MDQLEIISSRLEDNASKTGLNELKVPNDHDELAPNGHQLPKKAHRYLHSFVKTKRRERAFDCNGETERLLALEC